MRGDSAPGTARSRRGDGRKQDERQDGSRPLAGEYGATWPAADMAAYMADMAVLSGACALALRPQRAA